MTTNNHAPVHAPAVPLADVHETEAAWVLSLEVPGAAEDKIDVSLEEDRLRVRAERTPAAVEGYRRGYGDLGSAPFERAFTVPGGLDADRIEAKLAAGVLTVTLPKAAPRRRTIDVRVG